MVAPAVLYRMEKKPKDRPPPEEEGIELHPDAWERFERNVQQA
jgi:hypothetical protein